MEGTIAEIRCFAGNFAPKNWAFCNAQTIAIQQNTALFSLLGTTYGGNGTSTFQLPDLQGRVPVGTGNGPGLTPMVLGQKGGTESVVLQQTQMPQHTHVATFTPTGGGGGGGSSLTATLNVVNTAGTLATGGAGLLAGSHGIPASTGIFAAAGTATVAMAPGAITINGGGGGGGITGGTVAVALAGGSQPFSIMQPYLGMNYIICMYGIFPSRN